MSFAAARAADTTGLVLAGGRGSRMGGLDKGLVQWRGEALALRAMRRLRPQVAGVAVNANRHQATYAQWGVPVWPDADLAFAGPMAGLLAGLTHCRTDWLVTVPCDTPLFPLDLVARLAAAAEQAGRGVAMAATPAADGPEAQPVFLLVHRSLRGDVAHALAAGERRVGRWAAVQQAALALFDDTDAFANANTPAELAALPPDIAP